MGSYFKYNEQASTDHTIIIKLFLVCTENVTIQNNIALPHSHNHQLNYPEHPSFIKKNTCHILITFIISF